MRQYRREFVSAVLAAFIAVAGTMVIFWKDTSVLSASSELRLSQIEQANAATEAKVEALQIELRQVYAMSAKLDAIAIDLKEVRQDVRELRAKEEGNPLIRSMKKLVGK